MRGRGALEFHSLIEHSGGRFLKLCHVARMVRRSRHPGMASHVGYMNIQGFPDDL
jgi:hypothetical protein